MYFQDILEEEKELARETGLVEGREVGLAEGRAEGRSESKIEAVIELYKNKVSKDIIAKSLSLSLDKVNEILDSNKKTS